MTDDDYYSDEDGDDLDHYPARDLYSYSWQIQIARGGFIMTRDSGDGCEMAVFTDEGTMFEVIRREIHIVRQEAREIACGADRDSIAESEIKKKGE